MKFVRYHNVILPAAVKDSFAILQENIFTELGIAIEPVDGFKPKQVIARELARRLKYRDLAKINNETTIESYSPLDFEPPLVGNKPSMRDVSNQEQVWTIPNMPSRDPRVTGRIIQIGPKNIINPTTLYYLVHNAGDYGFLHYGPIDPSIWYWRGDKDSGRYTAQQVVSTFTNELAYLL